MPTPTDFVNIDTSPKPCKCSRFWLRVSEIFLALALAGFIYTLALIGFSL